jgi:hypothetical protein
MTSLIQVPVPILLVRFFIICDKRINMAWETLYKLGKAGLKLFEVPEKQAGINISVFDLKRLLVQMTSSSINFRYRPIGEMWKRNLMKVSMVRETSVMLYEEKNGKYHLVNLNDIMQFEIDERLSTLLPHTHYEVIPSAGLA